MFGFHGTSCHELDRPRPRQDCIRRKSEVKFFPQRTTSGNRQPLLSYRINGTPGRSAGGMHGPSPPPFLSFKLSCSWQYDYEHESLMWISCWSKAKAAGMRSGDLAASSGQITAPIKPLPWQCYRPNLRLPSHTIVHRLKADD